MTLLRSILLTKTGLSAIAIGSMAGWALTTCQIWEMKKHENKQKKLSDRMQKELVRYQNAEIIAVLDSIELDNQRKRLYNILSSYRGPPGSGTDGNTRRLLNVVTMAVETTGTLAKAADNARNIAEYCRRLNDK